MLYEFVITVRQEDVNDKMEKLNIAGLYNLSYDQPIEIEKVQNGYSYKQLEEPVVELKIYGDEEEETGLPDSFLTIISQTLAIPENEIPYQKIENQWSFELEDIDLGNGWIIRYSDHPYPVDKKVLDFNPQAAFGTGLHETTQDALRIILEQDFSGKKVLDLGTGSGILTVGAGLRNAEQVVAIDYEHTEREVLLNAGLNQLTGSVTAMQEDLIDGPFLIEDDYDWIFINIGAEETGKIIEKHQLLDKSSNFLISGLVEWHYEHMIESFTKAGFHLEQQLQSNEWMTMVFKK